VLLADGRHRRLRLLVVGVDDVVVAAAVGVVVLVAVLGLETLDAGAQLLRDRVPGPAHAHEHGGDVGFLDLDAIERDDRLRRLRPHRVAVEEQSAVRGRALLGLVRDEHRGCLGGRLVGALRLRCALGHLLADEHVTQVLLELPVDVEIGEHQHAALVEQIAQLATGLVVEGDLRLQPPDLRTHRRTQLPHLQLSHHSRLLADAPSGSPCVRPVRPSARTRLLADRLGAYAWSP
jgi:hypothetical protein